MPSPLPRGQGAVGPDEQAADHPTAVAGDQLDLFADRACLARDLERSLREADFLQAARLRQRFEETYGGTAEIRALHLLDGPAEALGSGPPQEALPLWHGLDAQLQGHPRIRRLLREGVFRRLLRSHSADELASAWPPSLPAIAMAVASGLEGSVTNGRAAARQLVRDALVAGRRLESFEFEWDEPLADLLAEHEEAAWLACLGVIRRLWLAPRCTSEDTDALSRPLASTDSAEEKALAFWSCLRAAEDQDCVEAARHEARRRMKTLRPDLHAVYMRQARS